MKNKIIVSILALAMCMSLTACGPSKDSSSSKAVSKADNSLSSQETTTTTATTTSETESTTQAETTEPEHGTSAYVDYIALKAKSDAETATKEQLDEAINWLKNNGTNYFSGNDNMEKTMYYGELLEYKYKDTGDDLEKIGWQAFKTVKYVYRGTESVLDTATHDNLMELKDMLANYNG